MEVMYKKYWEKISYLYGFGLILDPRWRVDNYLEVLKVIEENMQQPQGIAERISNNAMEKFLAFYKTYEDEFRGGEMQPLDAIPAPHPSPMSAQYQDFKLEGTHIKRVLHHLHLHCRKVRMFVATSTYPG